ncbi:hypothetical protein Tco_1062514, partial [Tanacetum coccineum]
ASLAEAIRLDSLQKEEEAEQIHLDALLAQRIAEEEELSEQQKKRKAQVQFEAQHYTNEDWDLIRAKLKANAELSKSMLGSELKEKILLRRWWILATNKTPKRPVRRQSDEAKEDEPTKMLRKRRKRIARKRVCNKSVDGMSIDDSDKENIHFPAEVCNTIAENEAFGWKDEERTAIGLFEMMEKNKQALESKKL